MSWEIVLACVDYDVILVGYAQTAAVGSVLLIANTMYTELSGRSGRLSFDRKVCLFVGCFLALRCQGMMKDAIC